MVGLSCDQIFETFVNLWLQLVTVGDSRFVTLEALRQPCSATIAYYASVCTLPHASSFSLVLSVVVYHTVTIRRLFVLYRVWLLVTQFQMPLAYLSSGNDQYVDRIIVRCVCGCGCECVCRRVYIFVHL